MKGLIFSCMNRKKDAIDLVKLGIRNNPRSYVGNDIAPAFSVLTITAWHVFGILNRQEREYNEAIKCFLNALKIDKVNY
jgi:hypothetical protein